MNKLEKKIRNTINYDDVEISVSLLSKARYTDTYKADSLDKIYPEIKNIFEQVKKD